MSFPLTVVTSKFQPDPQKCPMFDFRPSSDPFPSPAPSSWPLSFNIAAQGLPVKQLSPGAHSSPRGHGRLVEQSIVWSPHDVPQKFVLIIGDLEGVEVVGETEGDCVNIVNGDVFAGGVATGMLSIISGCCCCCCVVSSRDTASIPLASWLLHRAHGLPLKQTSPPGHSSPRGQGKLQYFSCQKIL